MKKFYLCLVAVLAAFGAKAQDLQLLVDGKEYPSGSRVDITQFFEEEEGMYELDSHMAIKSSQGGIVNASLTFNQGESIPAWDEVSWATGAQVNLTWCAFDGQCLMLKVGETANKVANIYADTAEDMVLHFTGMIGDDQKLEDLIIKAECTVNCSFGGKSYTLTLYVDKDPSGVNDITFDANAPVEYYDLQGRRIANPSNGLYIVRQGSKVMKSIIK